MARDAYINWIKEADWDLETAKILKDKDRYNTSAFYAQQAVEKLIKAALMYKNESPWGHSTRELLIRLDGITDQDYSDIIHNALELDHHYILARYPNAHPNSAPHEVYDEIIAKNAIKNAELIFNRIKAIFEINNNNNDED